MAKKKNKARAPAPTKLVATTLGDLICQVYDCTMNEAHDKDLARRLACHCARRAARHQPNIPVS